MQSLNMARGLKFWIYIEESRTIHVAKTKAPISCAVTAQLICVFVFAYAKSRFSHDAAIYGNDRPLFKNVSDRLDNSLSVYMNVLHCNYFKYFYLNYSMFKGNSNFIFINEFLFRSVFLLSIIGSSSQSFSMLISFLIVL